MTCSLKLLGSPQLLDGHGRLIPIPAKAFALVAYILLTGGGAPVARAAVRQFLWDTPDAKTAATNLRKFLLRIRERQKQFGFELVREERDHVALTQSVEIDLQGFLQISRGHSPADIVRLCDLYRGELLESCPGEEPAAREWLDIQRTKLRDAFIGATAAWIEASDATTDRMLLRVAARRLIEVDSYNEAAHRALMQLFLDSGEPARVIDVYRSLEDRLKTELGVAPDAETTKLLHSAMGARNAQGPAALPSRETVHADVLADNSGPDSEATPLPISLRSGAPRITILPPTTVGGQDYAHQLAASLIEDVTIGLCRFKSLSVIAPHTAWELSQNGKKALLRSLRIDYAVETQLQTRDGELQLIVKLVSAVSRDILWIEHYTFSRENMARQYRELSVQIVSVLVDTVERIELVKYSVDQDPTAYHLYLTGQKLLRTLDLPSVRKARRVFKASIGSSADFVPAISGLAHTFHIEWLLMARGDNELLMEAEHLARRSLEIDPDDARGYRDLGLCKIYAGRFDESLEAFSHAERRNGQYADLLVDYADALQHSCEPSAALEKINRAIALNPLGPDRYWWTAGGASFHLQRYRDAIDAMSHMQDPSPAFRLLAASWAMLGERQKAAEYVRKATEIHPDFSVNGWLSILPIRDPAFAQHYEQGLREAGFE
jgi:DNA-binding SARP family transcriptional activator